MKYYTLESLGAHNPHRWIDDWPYVEDMDFDTGDKIDLSVEIPDPLECPLKPLNPMSSDHGPEMPAFFEGTIPLFRDDFIAALKEFGVTNIDCYNALIKDPDDGKEYTNYKAVNVLGEIDFKTMEKGKEPLIGRHDVYIIVREDLKEHLLSKGYTKIDFMDLGDVALGV
jgi:hypothetical protein